LDSTVGDSVHSTVGDSVDSTVGDSVDVRCNNKDCFTLLPDSS